MNQTETTSPENTKIQWHPGFYAAAEIELRQNRDELEFHREYNLSKKPLQIDLLIIEKLKDVQLQNELGAIFRRYNIIEYKEPKDKLNIDVFFKAIGYAFLYKGLGESVNQIPLEELTVSIFRETRPVKLMQKLAESGCTVQEYAPGIYYIEGLMIPGQIIVTKELTSGTHAFLKVITDKLEKVDFFNFMESVNSFTEPGDKRNADAVLQVSISANKDMYGEIRRSDPTMCDALRELFKDELEDAHESGRTEGRKEGLMEGRKEGLTEGRKEEISRLSELYRKLAKENRCEELLQALGNPEVLEKLYEEFGLA